MKLMLTSCGLETPKLMEEFLSLLPCAPRDARALFIPTAAVFCDAIEVLPKCLEDLYRAGLRKDNISVHDLHAPLTEAFLSAFDCIYLPGGDTQHLAARLAEGSSAALLRYLAASRGVIVGVSAGAMVFSAHIPAELCVLPNALRVHCAVGTSDGALPDADTLIELNNAQGIVFCDGKAPQILS